MQQLSGEVRADHAVGVEEARRVVILAATSGIGVAEACALRWEDLSEDLLTMRIGGEEQEVSPALYRELTRRSPFGEYVFADGSGRALSPVEVLDSCR
jgi:integrase